MGFNFPTPATENQEFTPVAGLTYIYKAPRWMVKGAAVVSTPGGADKQVQFNNAGAFGGDTGLTFNAALDKLTLNGGAMASGAGLELRNIDDDSNIVLWADGFALRIEDNFAGGLADVVAHGLTADGSNPAIWMNTRGTYDGWITWSSGATWTKSWVLAPALTSRDMAFTRYAAGGAAIDSPLKINFATGVVNFTIAPTIAGAAFPTGITQAQGDARYEPLDSAYTKAEGDAKYEPTITGGTVAQYWRGDKSWQTLPSATPGGSTTQVQFNDGGAFAGDAGLVFDKTTDKLTVAGVVSIANGTVAAPGLSFASSASSGVYWATGVGLAYGGASKLLAGSTTTTSSQPILNATGTVSAPSYSFTSNPNSGLWLNGTSLEVTVNSVTRLALSTTAITSTLPIVLPGAPTADLHAATKLYVDGKSPTVPAGAALVVMALSDTAPATPVDNMLWFNTFNLKMYIRFNDGSSTQWVQT